MDQIINAALWVMQSYLAIIFLSTGLLKLVQPVEKVRQLVPELFPLPFVRLLGGLEVLAAPGILLPWLSGILPVLTPLSALGMSLALTGAALLHSRQRKWSKVAYVGMLLVIALGVAYFRFMEVFS